jgi:hypothetical protein
MRCAARLDIFISNFFSFSAKIPLVILYRRKHNGLHFSERFHYPDRYIENMIETEVVLGFDK